MCSRRIHCRAAISVCPVLARRTGAPGCPSSQFAMLNLVTQCPTSGLVTRLFSLVTRGRNWVRTSDPSLVSVVLLDHDQ
jgi:hypothetical protein